MDCPLCSAVDTGSPGLRAPGSCDRRTCLLHVAHRLQSVALPLGATQKAEAWTPVLHRLSNFSVE